MPKEAKAFEDAIINGKNVLEMNMTGLKSQQHKDSAIEELHALQHQCRRLIHFVCTGRDDRQADLRSYSLRKPASNSNMRNAQAPSNIERQVVANSAHIDYFYQGKTYQRFSPMLVRLIQIAFPDEWEKNRDRDDAEVGPVNKCA